MEVKTTAILKLAYLEMYGYDMSWAAFHVLEVMASRRFQQKRVGYLAALQSLRADSDVLTLATNLLKKDLGSTSVLESALALSGVASVVTPSLAHDVADDVARMTTHTRPYVRKKAVLAMYKVVTQYPEALPGLVPRLRDRLADPDPSVVSAAVSTACELANSPGSRMSLLELAPPLYELLTTSKNNWMLIKILKLFSALAPAEPRLRPKLLPQVLQLMESTGAMSLTFECVNCIVSAGMLTPDDDRLASVCIGKLRDFLQEPDQNLKYVGLLALAKMVRINPDFVAGQEDIVLECVDDADLTLRQRVLDILAGIANENNVYRIVTRLLDQLHAESALDEHHDKYDALVAYRFEAMDHIIDMCSRDTYALVPDFEWYTGILVALAGFAKGHSPELGRRVGAELRNMAVRVVSVRDTIVAAAAQLLNDNETPQRLPSVLPHAIWVVGEYASLLEYPSEVLSQLLALPQQLHAESPDAEAIAIVAIPAVVKVFTRYQQQQSFWSSSRREHVLESIDEIIPFLESYATSSSYEVQERAAGFLELFRVVRQGVDEHPGDDAEDPPLLLTLALPSLFSHYELNPVAATAQRRIAVPDDLDLDTPICLNEPASLDFDNDTESEDEPDGVPPSDVAAEAPVYEETPEERERRRQERLERQRDDPFYISVRSESATPTPTGSRPMTPSSTREGQSTTDNGKLPSKPPGPARRKVEILQDETIPGDDPAPASDTAVETRKKPSRKGILKLENRLAQLTVDQPSSSADVAAEVNRLRQELLQEQSKPANDDGSVEVVHKKIKKTKKKKDPSSTTADGEKKKKKKKKPVVDPAPSTES